MTSPKSEADLNISRLCSFLFLRDPECQINSGLLFNTISVVTSLSPLEVFSVAERLMDKSLEDRNSDLFMHYKDGTIGKDLNDFKVLLCIAFAAGISLKELVGPYQLDLLTIVADMTKDQLEETLVQAQKRGLVHLPSQGSA